MTEETTANSLEAFDTLRQFLEEDGWHPQPLEDRHIYRMGFSGTNGTTACYAQIVPELDQFLFYVVAPVKAPETARPSVAEFITRANYGLRIGNFEMDYRDGETLLNPFGQIIEQEWLRTGQLRANVTLDEYVVMPNHFHALLILHDDPVGAPRRDLPKGPPTGSLGAIVGHFKSACTKRINRARQTPGAPVWQRNYYERIVHNRRELTATRGYIRRNPANWHADTENPHQ